MSEPMIPLVRFQTTNLCSPPLARNHGLSQDDFQTLHPLMEEGHQVLMDGKMRGDYGFHSLPGSTAFLDEIEQAAEEIAASYDHFVVLGIGGSALGAKALETALTPAFKNLSGRSGRPVLTVIDNVDPLYLAEFVDFVDVERTAFNVITKSGGTPETMTQFLILADLLGSERMKTQVWVTTDPERGDLRALAREQGLQSLPVPQEVGGRFSVLSPVGLLPAAVLGIDIRALLGGAAEFNDFWEKAPARENPAYQMGAACWALHRQKGKSNIVLFSYSQRLFDVADWFRQLWAESLGKHRSLSGEEVHAGSTPIRALGTTDQHSQLQLYTEGPNDKTLIFLHVDEVSRDVEIPALFPEKKSLAYLGGHPVSELFAAELRGTEVALREGDRPTARLTVGTLDERHVGFLLQMLEVATVFAGHLYGVDPFNQPGVERGKIVASALLGKEGLDDVRAELEEAENAPEDPRA